MNLSDIKILIIENDTDDAKYIKNALVSHTDKIGSKFNKNNILQHIVKPININGVDKEKEPSVIYNETKNIINQNDIDVLFIDLNLGKSTQQGIQLIRQYMNDPILASIPKYVITTETNFLEEKDTTGVYINTDIQHFTTILNKPTPNEEKYYISRFNDEQLFESLPVIASVYQKQKTEYNIEYIIKEFETKTIFMLSEDQNSTNLIISNVTKVLNVIESIDEKVENINQKTIAIEIMTKSIAKALPKIADKKKAKQIIDEWENNDDFKNIMGRDFPEMSKGLYSALKEGWNNILDNATEDISQVLYDAGKEYIDKQAGVDDNDDKIVLVMKYSSFFAEKIWEAKKAIL